MEEQHDQLAWQGLQPGGDVLSAVLAHLEDVQRQRVAERLRSTGQAEVWAQLLEARATPAEPPRQELSCRRNRFGVC